MPSAVTPADGRPDRAGGAPHASADLAAEGEYKARPLRVAVADGDPATHPFYQEALARLGHQVCLALTGRQLVEQCRLLRPDLVITSAQLPDTDGVSAAEEAVRDRPTPVILVAEGDAGATQRPRVNRCVFACLLKPLKEADLTVAVVVALRQFEQLESAQKEAADLRKALEDRKLTERAKGLLMRYAGVGEEEAYRRLRKLASDQNRKLVEVAQAVLAAGEVFRQMEELGARLEAR
jgi:response regulator NasT